MNERIAVKYYFRQKNFLPLLSFFLIKHCFPICFRWESLASMLDYLLIKAIFCELLYSSFNSKVEIQYVHTYIYLYNRNISVLFKILLQN